MRQPRGGDVPGVPGAGRPPQRRGAQERRRQVRGRAQRGLRGPGGEGLQVMSSTEDI